LTVAQWAALAPLLPAQSTQGRPPKWTRRQLIDGIDHHTTVPSRSSAPSG